MLIVSMTSIPPRFSNLSALFANLASQSLRPDVIRMNLPRKWRRFDHAELPTVPPDIELHLIDEDAGPALKLLPTLRDVIDKDVRILVCDDDWIFGDDWIKHLMDVSRKHPAAAVTGSGYRIDRFKLTSTSINPGQVDIAQGFSGILLKPSMFDDEVFNMPESAWAVDDIWISAMLARSKTPIFVAPHACSERLAMNDASALQSVRIDGMDRAAANLTVVNTARETFGIWDR